MEVEVVVQARRPALQAADHDQVRQRASSRRAPAAAPEMSPLGGEALACSADHRLVGGIGGNGAWHRTRGYFTPSLAAASRRFFTSAVGFLRPSSFSPRRLTQITGT